MFVIFIKHPPVHVIAYIADYAIISVMNFIKYAYFLLFLLKRKRFYMNEEINEILQTFHDATDLNLYVFTGNKISRKYTSPLAPNIPPELVAKLKHEKELNLMLINNQSSLGEFDYQDVFIFGWNSNFTISSGANYDRLAPLLGWNKFVQNMKCLFFMVYKHWPQTKETNEKFAIGENIISVKQKKASYEGYLAECELMDTVSSLNISLFNKSFRVFVKNGNLGDFRQSKLRNEKDMAIAATTLYTRAAVKGGVPASEAYSLSDKIIKQIEKDTVISNYYEYTRAIGEIFVNRVYRFKRQNITSLVFKAEEYIYNNFTTISSVEEVADYIGVSVSYLQHLFKDQAKVSILSFINQQKINLAKHELIFTNKTIEEISNETGFTSLSVFSSTFKRITNMSPSMYRKQHV